MIDKNGFITDSKHTKIDKSYSHLIVREVDFMSDEELLALPIGSVMVFDVECYRNFFYVCFKSLDNGKYVDFELSAARALEADKLSWLMWRFCLVGFNSINYDMPMITLALNKLDTKGLKDASDFIIQSGINYGNKKTTPFDVERKYGCTIPQYNHIDLFNVCPVNGGVSANPASLKLYAGRLHAPRMQDLPIEPDADLTQEEAALVRPYCANDLDNTHLLFEELAPELQLRIDMSEQYGVELRSKSDAQIAETVICKELQKVLGYYPKRPNIDKEEVLKYSTPSFIQFQTANLNKVLKVVQESEFYLDGLGSPVMPEALSKLEVVVGKTVYKLGMGGLHSKESSICYFANDEIVIRDNDVESYYPRIILNQGLFPQHLGQAFLEVYNKIVTTRVEAKEKAKQCKEKGDKEGSKHWKTVSNSLKICINGSFGKLGNKYSALYSPQLLLQVTLTGQLALLMLIEAIEGIGVDVISGNTDGIVSVYHKSRHDEVRRVIELWEQQTNFKTEETRYKAVLSRDVNSYIAIKDEEGDPEAKFLDERLGCKTKGTFCERGSALNSILSKNPESMICNDAVLQFLKNRKPIKQTVRECQDIRRFVTVRNVQGGAVKDGMYLGKTIRWYYAKGETTPIHYVKSGNKVPMSDGAKPCMDLPKEFPQDIDYDWYEKEAVNLLYDCGFYQKPKDVELF